jgi:hypothetical protein
MKNPAALIAWKRERRLLCDRCAESLPGPIEDYGDIEYGGEPCTLIEYVEKAKENPNVWIVCQPCLDAMPDAPSILQTESGREVEIDTAPAPIM